MSVLQKPKIAQLILAAGSSSRMGTPKQLLPWNGITLIGHAIDQGLQAAIEQTYVVLGCEYDKIYKAIKHFPVEVLKNKDWQSGMGTSVSYGISYIKGLDIEYDGVLITLIDQPLIDTIHLNALINLYQHTEATIIASQFDQIIGVPAVFSPIYFEELSVLRNDAGARYIIKKYHTTVETIHAGEKAKDVDTMDQYQVMLRKSEQTE